MSADLTPAPKPSATSSVSGVQDDDGTDSGYLASESGNGEYLIYVAILPSSSCIHWLYFICQTEVVRMTSSVALNGISLLLHHQVQNCE